MGENISDAEVSSCFEMEEMRIERERRFWEIFANALFQPFIDKAKDLDGEKEVLRREMQSELEFIDRLNTSTDETRDVIHEHLMQLLENQTQLNDVNKDIVNLMSTLQELREQNYNALRADPVYALILEEHELQQKLNDLGYYVYSPTGSETYQ